MSSISKQLHTKRQLGINTMVIPKKDTKYSFNRYRYKKICCNADKDNDSAEKNNDNISDKYFITVDDGSWAILTENDFKNLQNNKLDDNLFSIAEREGIIATEFNEGALVERARRKYHFLSYGPSLHIIVPTLRCNMKCIYCHASSVDPGKKGYDMDEATARKTVEFIFKAPVPGITIEFQGGEPLLNFRIVQFINEYAKDLNTKFKKDLRLVIVSNLTAMNDEKLKYLIDNDIKICTSLDGPQNVHNVNRPYVGKSANQSTSENSPCNSDPCNSSNTYNTYDKVKEWILKINQEYSKRNIKDKLGALITTTRQSLQYPKEIVDEYVKLGFEGIHLRFLDRLGCASEEWDKMGYTAEEFIKFWTTAMDYILELNQKGTYIKERISMLILSKLLSLEDSENYLDLRSPCGAAIGQLLYNYDGSIYTCDEGRMVGSDIFKIGTVDMEYKEVLTSNKVCGIISASVNDCFSCDDCVYKPYCGLCPVCNYFEQGSIIAKVPETTRCKIYMAMFDYVVTKYFTDKNAKEVFEKWIAKEKYKNIR